MSTRFGVNRAAAYSNAVSAAGVVYISGQVALGDDGTIIGPGDLAWQVDAVFAKIADVLAAAGLGWPDVVKLTTYCTRADGLDVVRTKRRAVFADGHYPASTFVVVAGLADPGLLVELEATALTVTADGTQ